MSPTTTLCQHQSPLLHPELRAWLRPPLPHTHKRASAGHSAHGAHCTAHPSGLGPACIPQHRARPPDLHEVNQSVVVTPAGRELDRGAQGGGEVASGRGRKPGSQESWGLGPGGSGRRTAGRRGSRQARGWGLRREQGALRVPAFPQRLGHPQSLRDQAPDPGTPQVRGWLATHAGCSL